jgi:hypothetical protein
LQKFSLEQDVSVILIDGPQGWKSPSTGIEGMRICERVLNTPAKTGIIGHVKPRTFLRYIALSINMFHILRVDYGWKLLAQGWPRKTAERWIVEVFPSSAWLTLGLDRLPSKAKMKPRQIKKWSADLTMMTGLEIPTGASHDELQAAVVLPVGEAIAAGDEDRVILSGQDPRITRAGDILEGWIVNPLANARLDDPSIQG